MKPISRRVLMACALLQLCVPAFADNLGGLVFVVFIWPLGIILLLMHAVFFIVSLVKLKKKKPPAKSAYSKAVSTLSILTILAYPVIAIVLSKSFDSRAPADVLAISILPAVIPAAVNLYVCRKL